MRLLCIRSGDRIGAERQHAAQLTRNTANRAAHAAVTEGAAYQLTQRLSHLSDQVTEPALWRELLALLKLLLNLLLLQLLLLKLL